MVAQPAHHIAKPAADLTGTELLARAGFGHRRTAHSAATYKREVFRISTGEVVGEMSAHEATAFALSILGAA